MVSAQHSYKLGIRQGTVKVKFAKAMSTSVNTMRVSAPDGILKTGISSFDKVSEKHAARKMTRIFPKHPNPEIEARHVKHGLHLWYVVEVSDNENPVDVANSYAQLEEVQVAEVEREKILAARQ